MNAGGGSSHMFVLSNINSPTITDCTYSGPSCQTPSSCTSFATYTNNTCFGSSNLYTWPVTGISTFAAKMDRSGDCLSDTGGPVSYAADNRCVASLSASYTYLVVGNSLQQCYYTNSNCAGATPTCTTFTNQACQSAALWTFTPNANGGGGSSSTGSNNLPPANNGSHCISDADCNTRECSNSQWCSLTNFKCGPSILFPQTACTPMSLTINSCQCGATSYCNATNSDGSTGRCIAKQLDGGPCQFSSQCLTQNCAGGVCHLNSASSLVLSRLLLISLVVLSTLALSS
jgi:hypothetical protein